MLYNRHITEQGLALIDDLVASAPPVPGDKVWWLGRFVLQSSYVVAEALRDAGKWRLLDGAPVSVVTTGQDGHVLEIETDLLVLGCDTGLRISGSLQHDGIADDDAGLLRITLDHSEFFEPSDEFGITKALNKCEAELRPQLPSKEAPLTATLRPEFVDDSMVILRDAGKLKDRGPIAFVLSRLPPDEGDDLKAGLETDDDYS